MACSLYFYRAPKYKNLSFADIRLVESYLRWQNENIHNGKHACNTFEEWDGHSLSELPSVEAIEYYRPFLKQTPSKVAYLPTEYRCLGIFEQMGKLTKASQFVNWFKTNTCEQIDDLYAHEVSLNDLENLLEACNYTRKHCIRFIEQSKYGESTYSIDEKNAALLLPILRGKSMNLSFPYMYGDAYAEQIIHCIHMLNCILSTTNFDKQAMFVMYG